MNTHDKMPIIDVLRKIDIFNPVKITFNDFVLYDDYKSEVEIKKGIVGEVEPYMSAVPKRLEAALKNYNIWVTKIEISIVHYHHSIIQLYGEYDVRDIWLK